MRRLLLLMATMCASPSFAAEVAPPRLQNPSTWLTKREVPPGILKRGERVLTWLNLSISPEGLVTDCMIKQSSGYPTLDDYACNLFKQNGRFAPVHDDAGKAMSRTSEQYETWETFNNAIDADTSKAATAKPGSDYGMWVNSDDLPRGLMRPDEIVVSSLELTISAEGHVTSCGIRIPSKTAGIGQARLCADYSAWKL